MKNEVDWREGRGEDFFPLGQSKRVVYHVPSPKMQLKVSSKRMEGGGGYRNEIK